MSGCGRESHPDVREWSVDPPDVWEWSVDISDVREWWGGPTGCPGRVGRSLLDVLEWSEDHSQMFGSGREAVRDVRDALPDVRCGREALPGVREWSGGPPG